MASGRPDYFKGVDITYQSLSEVTNRPKYGGALKSVAVTTATASALKTLITVTGKGVLYGGYMVSLGSASQKGDVPNVLVDSLGIFGQSFDYLNDYSINVERSSLLFLRKFDDINFIYSVAMGYGYTFEDSIVVKYEEKAGNTPGVICELHYALV